MNKISKMSFDELIELENQCKLDYKLTLKKIEEYKENNKQEELKKEKRKLKRIERCLKKVEKAFENLKENTDNELNQKKDYIFSKETQEKIKKYGDLVDDAKTLEKDIMELNKEIETNNKKELIDKYNKKVDEYKSILKEMEILKKEMNVKENIGNNNSFDYKNINDLTVDEVKEKNYQQNKKEYEELLEQQKNMKKPKIFKSTVLLAIESLCVGGIGAISPVLGWIAGAGIAVHLGKVIKNVYKYELLNENILQLSEKIKKHEENSVNNDKEKQKKLSKEKQENTNKTTPKTISEKKEALIKAKEELLKHNIVDGNYRFKKDQIIQDRVNIKEICDFYGTNNTNPSNEKNKVKVITKKAA